MPARRARWPTTRPRALTFTAPGRARRSPTSRSRASSTYTQPGRRPTARTATSRSTRSARTVFAGAGQLRRRRRATALNAAEAAGTAIRRATSRSPSSTVSARELPGARGLHRRRQQAASCGSAASTAARRARSPPAARSATSCYGARRDDQRPDARRAVAVEASGLLAGGARQRLRPRHGRPRPTTPASAGVELRRRHQPGGAGDRRRRGLRAPAARTARARPARLQPARALPEPQRARPCAPTVAARRPAHADRARRPTPAATSSSSGPYPVFDVVTPSDRGALNGTGATETRHADRALDHGHAQAPAHASATAPRPASAGGWSTAPAQPIAGAQGARCSRATCARARAVVQRATLTTDADGRFSTTVDARPPRGCCQFAWRSHVNDIRFAANGYLTLQARATRDADASSTRRPRVGQTLHAQRPAARRRPRGGVPVIVQGRAGGSSATRRSPTRRRRAAAASRSATASALRPRAGTRSVFRARIRPARALPVRDAATRETRDACECAEK